MCNGNKSIHPERERAQQPPFRRVPGVDEVDASHPGLRIRPPMHCRGGDLHARGLPLALPRRGGGMRCESVRRRSTFSAENIIPVCVSWPTCAPAPVGARTGNFAWIGMQSNPLVPLRTFSCVHGVPCTPSVSGSEKAGARILILGAFFETNSLYQNASCK